MDSNRGATCFQRWPLFYRDRSHATIASWGCVFNEAATWRACGTLYTYNKVLSLGSSTLSPTLFPQQPMGKKRRKLHEDNDEAAPGRGSRLMRQPQEDGTNTYMRIYVPLRFKQPSPLSSPTKNTTVVPDTAPTPDYFAAQDGTEQADNELPHVKKVYFHPSYFPTYGPLRCL